MARIRTGCGRTTRRAVSVVAGRVRVYRGTRFSRVPGMSGSLEVENGGAKIDHSAAV